jgi:hypothetical protein
MQGRCPLGAENRLLNQTVELEECRRGSTGLKNVLGNCRHLERLRGDEEFGDWEEWSAKSRPILSHRGVLHQEEEEAIRQLRPIAMRRMVTRCIMRVHRGLRRELSEMMDTVWPRPYQQGEER